MYNGPRRCICRVVHTRLAQRTKRAKSQSESRLEFHGLLHIEFIYRKYLKLYQNGNLLMLMAYHIPLDLDLE
jgi:hypothetical protein